MSSDKIKEFFQNNVVREKNSQLFSSAESGPQIYQDGRTYFHYKADVSRFIDSRWNYFWTKARGETWINSASSALSTNSTGNSLDEGRFESGKAKYNKNGMWALVDASRFPSSYDQSSTQQKTRAVMYDISPDGTLLPIADAKSFSGTNLSNFNNSSSNLLSALNNSRKRRKSGSSSKVQIKKQKQRPRPSRVSSKTAPSDKSYGVARSKPTVNTDNFTQMVTRKKAYVPEELNDYINPETEEWSIKMWPDLNNPPGNVVMQADITHSAPQMKFEGPDNLIVYNELGYRMSKASHGISSGSYYFEAEILKPIKPNGNLRIGYAQISADLQAPCGYDHFSYSMRISPPTRFHGSVGHMYGESLQEGDTLGCLIHLPDKLDPDMESDLEARLWDARYAYKTFDYKQPKNIKPPLLEGNENGGNSEITSLEQLNIPPLHVIKDSELVYFKNGKCLGVAFSGLFLGKYYPAISSYMGGKARVIFGSPNDLFKYPPPQKWKGQIVHAMGELSCPLPEDAEQTSVKNQEDSSIKKISLVGEHKDEAIFKEPAPKGAASNESIERELLNEEVAHLEKPKKDTLNSAEPSQETLAEEPVNKEGLSGTNISRDSLNLEPTNTETDSIENKTVENIDEKSDIHNLAKKENVMEKNNDMELIDLKKITEENGIHEESLTFKKKPDNEVKKNEFLNNERSNEKTLLKKQSTTISRLVDVDNATKESFEKEAKKEMLNEIDTSNKKHADSAEKAEELIPMEIHAEIHKKGISEEQEPNKESSEMAVDGVESDNDKGKKPEPTENKQEPSIQDEGENRIETGTILVGGGEENRLRGLLENEKDNRSADIHKEDKETEQGRIEEENEQKEKTVTMETKDPIDSSSGVKHSIEWGGVKVTNLSTQYDKKETEDL
ncbi:Set1/Ash2 histone methyltransferase complex subunit ASH2 [Smittium mucronatum]|uniref:Set1/Ash2 histone methyltransferase complex subunit ASH2 n=1 Tax=Smittium mucronatum TaxID=133383 RepID=A0A1R0H7Q3_9FUNG|nr:Set1/Ash2 histone methyltransferase complex subunit ASH2 [Smittium mucronatum]